MLFLQIPSENYSIREIKTRAELKNRRIRER